MGDVERREHADERREHADDRARERSRHARSPHELDQVDELERLRSPERDWVAPLDDEERETATRDPRIPPARLAPYPGGEREDEAASEE